MTDPHGDLELIDLEPGAGADRSQGRRRPERAEPGQPTGRGWRSGGRRVALGVALIALLLMAWALWAYTGLTAVRDDLVGVRADMDEAVAAAAAGELDRAMDLLDSTRSTLATVPSRISGPQMAPARLVPPVRRTLDAVEVISTAAGSVAESGFEVFGALDLEEGGLGGLAPSDGRIPLATFQELAPLLEEAEADIAESLARVGEVPRLGIDPAVRDARDTFLDMLQPVAGQITRARQATAIVPALFGADGPRRYMVVASNPTEARGSGGFYGAYTIMEADGGELSFSEVRPTQDLPELPRGEIPWPDPSLEERYDAYGGTGFIVNLNMTPDFPSAATALERFYAAAVGEPIDGVMAVDPYAFEALLQIAGPVEIPGFGPVGPEEVVEFVSHGAYAEITDAEERKRLIGLVATAALQGFLDSPDGVSADQVLSAVSGMVARESILVHVADPDLQEVVADLGLAGRLGPPEGTYGDYLGVFLNSGASYKVDYWLQRQVRYEVTLAPSGQSSAIVSTGFTNAAPTTGEPAYMIGFGGGLLDVGDALSFVSVYCTEGCRFHEVPDSGFEGLQTESGRELGLGVTSTWMRLPAGRSKELLWSWSTDDAWQMRGLDQVYRLHYGHQTTPSPVDLDIRVNVPEGSEVIGMPEGAVVEEGQVRLRMPADRDLALEFTFRPPSGG